MAIDTDILNEIIEGCKRNEQGSQRRLYDLYAKQMTAVCMRYTGDYDTARDLMHDGFIKIFKSIYSYKGDGSFEGWVRRIFVNLSLDYLKKRQESTPISSIEYMLSDSEEEFVGSVEIEKIFDAIQQLPDVARTIFNMFNVDGYSMKEICEKLNMTNVAVRSQHHRAKEKIREIIKSREEDI